MFLTRAIVESIELYGKQKGIEISFSAQMEHEIIGIDDEKYEIILLNILCNAIKFTPVDGRIDVRLSSNGDSVCIEVEDTGIGLSLVKSFVEAMGGCISLTSEVGSGSLFTIVLPKDQTDEVDVFNGQLNSTNDRLINTISIEFSDIYLTV